MGFYESVKHYVQRRKYQRLDGSRKRRRHLRIATMGGRRRRVWRLKFVPRLKLRWFNPKVLLVKLRDAYVNMMLNLANTRVFSNDAVGAGFGTSCGVGGGNPFGQMPLKEYDEKMLVEIYKSLMIQGQMRELQMQLS